MTLQEIITNNNSLPASLIANDVNETLAGNQSLVVTAPPGAGKSTLLPLTILAGLNNDGGKILMLEPRRLAARQIAERMAQMLGEEVGKTVGYRIRFENKVSKQTRIEVLTEGILTRMLVDDATLEGVSVVIFDEFHERSINSDLALALTRQAQEIIRPDLKIVIMSATIDASNICAALKTPLIESEGRMFPVEINYTTTETDRHNPYSSSSIASATASAIVKAHEEHEGDILAFLPGQGEIERCMELLGTSLSPTEVMPLYGNLSSEQQRRAIAPSRQGERKVVLATPIAETSITIEGVRVVVDSGLCRQVVFDSRTGLSHLETVRISRDMATQRMGRAGRVAEGTCYRLWTKASEHLMAEQRTAEIEDADLAPMILDIAAFGENDVETLPWLTLPPRANVFKAKNLLMQLGAIDENGNITPMGKQMSALSCHPRIARMILATQHSTFNTPHSTSLACDIAALLEEKDPLADSNNTDLSLRISMLRSARKRKQIGRWARIAMIAAEYLRMAHANEDNSDPAPEEVGLLVAYAYPERIALSTNNVGGYRLASGDNVQLDSNDSLAAHKWLAIASLYSKLGNTGRVFLAAPLNPNDLDESIIKERDNISWDAKQGCVTMQKERRIGKLLVDSKPIHNADKEDVIYIICEAMAKNGLSMLTWSDEQVQRLQRRVAQVAAWHPELNIPDISTEHLTANAKDWLPLYLDEGGHVKSTINELRRLNLAEILWNIIPYETQVEIDRLAPTHIKVPTGSHIRIDYRQGAEAPVLSVRLQECFGMEQTPCVNDGQQPVLMELLSPGFKPVQLTQDLASFWKGTYFEVRKELRRRYPKHYWPENPLEAEAVKGVRRNN
ncbi:ATP-dependent helicase HrpB [uncultured Prevotella sp.]|uniref:ATP-dependent helicase HrpB n=1 Tax=uncultured Prevotella sp. TaxID=159272 RepID=UPI0027E39A04|nr:ATP-dependent helicase HrpB [uncultured Prevotella sp.]